MTAPAILGVVGLVLSLVVWRERRLAARQHAWMMFWSAQCWASSVGDEAEAWLAERAAGER